MKKILTIISILLTFLSLSGCGKKTVYTGYYNYIGEATGYSEARVSIHITRDQNRIYTIAIKDGDYATDCITFDHNYYYGNRYHGSFTYDGAFRQGKTYSFIAGPSDYPYLDKPYNSDILVDLQFNGNQLLYKNSKSLRIADKDEFDHCDFIKCDKVIVE